MLPEELQLHLKYIRHHGVIQFLNIWRRLKDVQNDELKFGDEIECGVFVVDHESKTIKLSVRAAEARKFSNSIIPISHTYFLSFTFLRFANTYLIRNMNLNMRLKAALGILNMGGGWWNQPQVVHILDMQLIYFVLKEV